MVEEANPFFVGMRFLAPHLTTFGWLAAAFLFSNPSLLVPLVTTRFTRHNGFEEASSIYKHIVYQRKIDKNRLVVVSRKIEELQVVEFDIKIVKSRIDE